MNSDSDHEHTDIDAKTTSTRPKSPPTLKSELPLTQHNPQAVTVRDVDYQKHPNAWSRLRWRLREPAAEFLGTMILVFFGTAVNCQVVLSSNTSVAGAPFGSYTSTALAWGAGLALGAWVAGGISGGHVNPAVTLALVVFRRFPLKKLPVYVFSQILGGFVGSLLAYANYWRAIDLYEGGKGIRTVPGTAGLFATFPVPYLPAASCFFSEFLGTAILLIVVFAVTDKRNAAPSAGTVPLALFFALMGITACMGMQTSFALNPARDLGPRLMTWIFYGREVWNYRSQYWLWTPILATLSGALAGGGVYDLLIFTGDESRINSPRFPPFISKRNEVSETDRPDMETV